MTVLGPYGFRGGLNLKSSSINLPKDQMTDAQNVFVVYNDLVKATGSVKVNTAPAISATSNGTVGLLQWKLSGTSYVFQESANASNQEVFDYITNLGSSITSITDSVGLTNPSPSYAILNSLLVRVADSTTAKWAGPGNNIAALGGSPPSGTVCAVASNFLFIASGSRLYWSNVSDPETWNAANYVDFRKNDGDSIVGLSSYNQNILIWKSNSIGQLFTNTTSVSGSTQLAPLTTIRTGIGLASRQAWDMMDATNICFVASNNHVFIFDGANFTDISDPPYPRSNVQPLLDSIKISQTSPIVVNYPTRNQVWIATADGTSSVSPGTHNIILIYNYSLGVWESKLTGRNAQSMISYISSASTDGGANPIAILTGDVKTYVYQQDDGNSNAEDTNGVIDGYGTTSIELSPAEGDFNPACAIVLVEAAGAWAFEVNYGFNSTSDVDKTILFSLAPVGKVLDQFVLDTDKLGAASLLREKAILLANNQVSSIQLQYRNRNSGQPFTVHPFYLSDQIIE